MKIHLVTNILQTYLNQRRPLNKRIFYLPDNVVWLNFGMPAMEWALAIYHHIKKTICTCKQVQFQYYYRHNLSKLHFRLSENLVFILSSFIALIQRCIQNSFKYLIWALFEKFHKSFHPRCLGRFWIRVCYIITDCKFLNKNALTQSFLRTCVRKMFAPLFLSSHFSFKTNLK